MAARGCAIVPPRVKIVYHCFTARGAGACIAAGMLTTERETLLPGVLSVGVVHGMCSPVPGDADSCSVPEYLT
jgi:hypothetical protein